MSSSSEVTGHMSSNDLGAENFFRKCPRILKGHVLDMSYVLKCVLKISKGQVKLISTKMIGTLLGIFQSSCYVFIMVGG